MYLIYLFNFFITIIRYSTFPTNIAGGVIWGRRSIENGWEKPVTVIWLLKWTFFCSNGLIAPHIVLHFSIAPITRCQIMESTKCEVKFYAFIKKNQQNMKQFKNGWCCNERFMASTIKYILNLCVFKYFGSCIYFCCLNFYSKHWRHILMSVIPNVFIFKLFIPRYLVPTGGGR